MGPIAEISMVTEYRLVGRRFALGLIFAALMLVAGVAGLFTLSDWRLPFMAVFTGAGLILVVATTLWGSEIVSTSTEKV